MAIFSNFTFGNRLASNLSDGYQPGDVIKSIFNFGSNQSASSDSSVKDWQQIQEQYWAAQKDAALQQQEAAQASADRAMQFSHDEAELDRQWQERLSNTAYQRSMSDMKAAGLNPILMFSKGFSSASTPSGAAGTGSAASMDAANVDTDALVSLLRESMANQSAQTVAVMNNTTKVLTSLIGKAFPTSIKRS